MTGEAEKLQGDPTIAHSESPTKRRIEHPTETHTGQPTQRASGPSELPTWHPTSMFAESPNETPTNTPTEIQTVAPTEPPTDPTIEPPTESRSEAESQHMIRDRDEKSKTSDSAKPDEEETKVSETSQGSVDLDRSVAHLERVEIIASHDETALPAPQILFDGGEMSTTASPSALTAHHAVREMNPIPRSSERIQITQDLNMHQPPVEDSSRASTSMYLEEPPLASPGAVAADGETARPGQRTSTQTVEPGYGKLRQPVCINVRVASSRLRLSP